MRDKLLAVDGDDDRLVFGFGWMVVVDLLAAEGQFFEAGTSEEDFKEGDGSEGMGYKVKGLYGGTKDLPEENLNPTRVIELRGDEAEVGPGLVLRRSEGTQRVIWIPANHDLGDDGEWGGGRDDLVPTFTNVTGFEEALVR